MTTPEKRAAALEAIRRAFERTDLGLDNWLCGIGAAVADHRQVFLSALTQPIFVVDPEKLKDLPEPEPGEIILIHNKHEKLQFIEESGWLVERHHKSHIEYASMNQCGVEWASDANDAIRFCRQADADKFASGSFDEDDIRVAEHLWQSRAYQKASEGV